MKRQFCCTDLSQVAAWVLVIRVTDTEGRLSPGQAAAPRRTRLLHVTRAHLGGTCETTCTLTKGSLSHVEASLVHRAPRVNVSMFHHVPLTEIGEPNTNGIRGY